MPGLKAVISADSNPMKREFEAVGRMAERAGVKIQQGINGGHGHGALKSGAIREALVLVREMSAGNWTKVPGSLSILLQQVGFLKLIFKDTAAEASVLAQALTQKAVASQAAAIAAKAQAETSVAALASMRQATAGEILAARADQQRAISALASADADRIKAVAATEAAVALEAEGTAAKFALGPIGWLAVGVVALGTAAYFTVRHFMRLTEEAKNLKELTEVAKVKFSEQAEALKHAAEEAQGFDDWLKKLADSEEGLADKTEEALKALREQGKLQREIASDKGASKKRLAEMEIEQVQKELMLVTAAKLQAQRKVEDDTDAARAAASAVNDPERSGKIKQLGEKSTTAGRVADAIQAAMKTATVLDTKTVPYGQGYITSNRAANPDDKIPVKVDGKEYNISLNEAKSAANTLAAEELRLAKIQKELSDLLEQKKKLTEKDLADFKKLTREAREIQNDLDARNKYPREGKDSKLSHGSTNSLQQVGAYAAPATAMLDVTRRMDHKLGILVKQTAPHSGPRTTHGKGKF